MGGLFGVVVWEDCLGGLFKGGYGLFRFVANCKGLCRLFGIVWILVYVCI